LAKLSRSRVATKIKIYPLALADNSPKIKYVDLTA
jgi:hypothetical protein